MSWFDASASIGLFRSALVSPDLACYLPHPPAERVRPPVVYENTMSRTLAFWRMVHVLLTFLAYGERRRAQKKRANGWAPALRLIPALASLGRRDIRLTCHAANTGRFPTVLGEDMDVLVRLMTRTRRALLKHEEGATDWQAALEKQLRRTWETLDNTLAAWTPEECLAAEQEGWRACWRRLFGTKPPADLLPPEPERPPRPAELEGMPLWLPLRASPPPAPATKEHG